MKRVLVCILASLSFSIVSQAMEQQWSGFERYFGSINCQWEQIGDQELVKSARTIMVPPVSEQRAHGVYTSHEGMRKTVLVIEMGSAIKSALKAFKSNKSKEALSTVAKQLGEKALNFDQQLVKLAKTQQLGHKFYSTVDLMRALAKNIAAYEIKLVPKSYARGFSSNESVISMASLSVTTGGAKDIGHFRKGVSSGNVPAPDDFPMEGFMSEFELSIEGLGGSEYLSVHPTSLLKFNENNDARLFVQLGVTTDMTSATFKRKPLNLGIVLDISGSMNAKDDTEQDRLKWAKDVIDLAVEKMTPQDILSIVIFDNKTETILDPQNVVKESVPSIKKTYCALEPRGGTDVYLGLQKGYELVSKNKSANYENRVILISDAGTNTGYGTEETLLKLISDNAAEVVPTGLTAIGMGENFKQNLINSITMGKGGNYIFVQSGLEMVNFFEQFDFLVSPVAYNFKANVMLNNGVKARLVAAYGVPMKENEPLGDVINVRTLFFAGKGGGAMVLEYALES